jgi:hypothetical protein
MHSLIRRHLTKKNLEGFFAFPDSSMISKFAIPKEFQTEEILGIYRNKTSDCFVVLTISGIISISRDKQDHILYQEIVDYGDLDADGQFDLVVIKTSGDSARLRLENEPWHFLNFISFINAAVRIVKKP